VDLSPDGRWLAVEVSEGWSKSEIFLFDTRKHEAPIPVVTGISAIFNLVEVLDDRLLVVSNENAPHYQLWQVDPQRPEREHWKLLIPEGHDTLESVAVAGGKLVALYLKDACSRIRVFSGQGKPLREIALPGLGTVSTLHARHDQRDLYFPFTSFLTPTKILRYDVSKEKTDLWKELTAPVDTTNFTVEQVHYPSKDGTQVPMFLVHKKELVRDGSNPTLLYGYGGFNVNLTPGFAAWVGPFIERGGVYAVPNLRGGGEYGEAWHLAGTRAAKPRVFEDFEACAEHLCTRGITSPRRLAIAGASNGGLLVGACITRRPDLFGAALPDVGVLDMLRFHKFTIGWAWVSDYGSPDDAEDARVLLSYSPLHRLVAGAAYPATLITTADHDDRVVCAHSFKFAAALQVAQGGDAPVLIRIDTKAGHGAGKPTSKLIDVAADRWAFLAKVLG
jgi:prolyl oligopeptidase